MSCRRNMPVCKKGLKHCTGLQYGSTTTKVQSSVVRNIIRVLKLTLQSNLEKKTARQKCMENRLRLGQFVTQRQGASFVENWVDGYAFSDLIKYVVWKELTSTYIIFFEICPQQFVMIHYFWDLPSAVCYDTSSFLRFALSSLLWYIIIFEICPQQFVMIHHHFWDMPSAVCYDTSSFFIFFRFALSSLLQYCFMARPRSMQLNLLYFCGICQMKCGRSQL